MNIDNLICINMRTNTYAYAGISVSNHISTIVNIRNTIRYYCTSRRVGHRVHSGISINSNTNIY